MEEENVDIYELSENVNFTDPIVRHDPTIEKGIVAQLDISDDGANSVEGIRPGFDNKKYNAIDVPVILLNNYMLDRDNIESMSINYDGFLPTLFLIVSQHSNEISAMDTPGLSNVITVGMTSMVDGAFKPISLDFYITSVKTFDNEIYYYGTYKLLSLEQTVSEEIGFDGCDSEFCKLEANEHPTTYEFLHVIAQKTGLGFATTDQVKEIADDKYRYVTNQNYKDVIQQHLKFGGLDENSIFDGWIDLYRYLVVVNVPWVLNENIEMEDLGNYVESKSLISDGKIPHQQDNEMSIRIISNYKELVGNTNLQISSYKWKTNNKGIIENGTSNQFMIGSPTGYSAENNGSLNQKDIEIQENSPEGIQYKDDYEFKVNKFLGFEMGNAADGNTPVLYQEQIRNSYFQKIRQRRLQVNMETPNMGLQRGTLVNVLIMEYDTKTSKLLVGATNSDTNDEILSGSPVSNNSVSGLYYIDGMEFTYEKDDNKITQVLYLIKKDPYISPNAKTGSSLERFLAEVSDE